MNIKKAIDALAGEEGLVESGRPFDSGTFNRLERLLDQHGLKNLLIGIAVLCFEKGDNFRKAGDGFIGKVWERVGQRVSKLSDDLPIM